MGIGIMSGFIVFPVLYVAKLLFQKGAVFSRRESRFDKSIREGALWL